jgi:hypothetical protein
MRFAHLLIAPIDVDSDVEQRLGIDELTVAVARP